jgi:hypothetical protein
MVTGQLKLFGLARETDHPNGMETLAQTSRKSRCGVQDRGDPAGLVLRRQVLKRAHPEITSSNSSHKLYNMSDPGRYLL